MSTEQKHILHAIGNAHIDPVWLWRWPEGIETIRSTFRSVLDRMNEYPDFYFTGSSAAFYAWLKAVDADLFAEVKARVQEGRWEIVGGWWIQPDANIPSGESLVRQAVYGQRFFQNEFGVIATIGYNPDTFGHTGILPQILLKAGLKRYVFMRPMAREKTLPGNVFLWQSPDGSEVLTSRIAGSYGTWGEELMTQVQRCIEDKPAYTTDYMVFYGVGNHGGGPTIRNIESLLEMQAHPGKMVIALSTLDGFFTSIESDIKKGGTIPVVRDDLQHHARGCYTAESDIKRQNRRTEHILLNAERMSSVAWLALCHTYPRNEMTSAWQHVLFNQFHDILAGSSLPEAYQDARDSYGSAAAIGNKVTHFAMQAISSRIDSHGKGDALVIFNPLPWNVTVPIEVERGSDSISDSDGMAITAQAVQATTVVGQRRSVFVADLPAMGYRLFRQDMQREARDNPLFKAEACNAQNMSKAQEDVLRVTPTEMENQFWLIEINADNGHISRLYDKRWNVDVLNGDANVGVVLDDPSDTWSHEVVAFRNEIGSFGDAQISVVETGPVRVALNIETRWGKSTIQQRMIIYRDIDLIECRMTVNWQEQMKMLKLSFPLRLDSPRATYDLSYGSIQRTCNGEEEPGQQWLDVSGYATDVNGVKLAYGLSLLNDCKYGYDVLDADMRMSILRSPIYAYHDPYKPESGRHYVYQDQGIQTVNYRLIPHAGEWREAAIPRRAWELNAQPLWVNEYNHAGTLPTTASYLNANPDNILLTVCKMAEDEDALIVRGYESAGKSTRAYITMQALGINWDADFGAHEIKSWMVKPGTHPSVVEVDLLERMANVS